MALNSLLYFHLALKAELNTVFHYVQTFCLEILTDGCVNQGLNNTIHFCNSCQIINLHSYGNFCGIEMMLTCHMERYT
jgi:hypothetical protein